MLFEYILSVGKQTNYIFTSSSINIFNYGLMGKY